MHIPGFIKMVHSEEKITLRMLLRHNILTQQFNVRLLRHFSGTDIIDEKLVINPL